MLEDIIDPISIEGTNKILHQMKNSICKKCKNTGEIGSGFFCKIPYKNKLLPVLITNNHVIDEEDILEKKRIRIFFGDVMKILDLKYYEMRKIYSNKEYDVTIIEINKNYDNFDNDFLELDDELLFKYDDDIYYNHLSIYMLSYQKGKEAMVSYGILKNIEDHQNIHHLCYSGPGASGSPLLNLKNNKVIGIHKTVSHRGFGLGTFLRNPINEFNNDINIIRKFKNYKDEDFTNLKLISSGSFGEVYSAINNKEEKELCLKKINISKMKLI